MPLRFQPARGASVLLSSSSRGPTGSTGSTGATGATGPAIGVQFTYSTTTTDSDPGAGTFRLNHATIASATAAYIDNLDSGGGTASTWLDTFDDSTNTAKGTLVIRGVTTQSAWAVFNVTGSVTDGTGYRKLNLTHVGSGGTWTTGETFAFNFSRSGDKGVDGTLSVSGTPTVGQFGIWTDATTQKGVSVTGLVKGNGASDPTAAAAGTDYVAPGGALGTPSSGTLTNCTGLPLAGVTDSTSEALGVGTLELGHASDTTFARSAAGTVTIEGGQVMLVNQTGTISKGWTLTPANIGTYTSTAGDTVTPENGNYQYVSLSGTFTYTLTAPASDCAVDILVILGASGSGVTFAFSGFKTAAAGASGSTFTAANSTWYVLSVRRINGVSTYSWSGGWT